MHSVVAVSAVEAMVFLERNARNKKERTKERKGV
jgi:hypothetical protein